MIQRRMFGGWALLAALATGPVVLLSGCGGSGSGDANYSQKFEPPKGGEAAAAPTEAAAPSERPQDRRKEP